MLILEIFRLVEKSIPLGKKAYEDFKGGKVGDGIRDILGIGNHVADLVDSIMKEKLPRTPTSDTTALHSAMKEFPEHGFSVEYSMEARKGPLRRLVNNIFLNLVKAKAKEEFTANGFKLVEEELRVRGVELKLKKSTEEDFERMMKKASTKGLTDEAILEYADDEKVGAFGDGKILEILNNIVQWIIDHQDQIMMVVKFILMMLAMFGI